MHRMHGMHRGKRKPEDREYAVKLVSYNISFPCSHLDGVQGVASSNPAVPTIFSYRKSSLGMTPAALFFSKLSSYPFLWSMLLQTPP
jgi:hypothetical protein